jgi:hypothetical protein
MAISASEFLTAEVSGVFGVFGVFGAVVVGVGVAVWV